MHGLKIKGHITNLLIIRHYMTNSFQMNNYDMIFVFYYYVDIIFISYSSTHSISCSCKTKFHVPNFIDQRCCGLKIGVGLEKLH
jgi:hypothetical protein